ncbi:hypothetical protein ACFQS7_27920 [Dankookia sp. GCM10030260]|uniref:hypothetical protein n=1 Tax=Dankookia sp. GCM10030260 TaxID=3273390 RepID=UPI003611C62F
MEVGHSYFSSDIVVEFGDALRAAGLRPKEPPVMDGQWHRAPVEGDRGLRKSGRYKGYRNGIRPAGFIQNFRTDYAESWKTHAPSPAMPPEARKAAQRAVANARAASDKCRQTRQDAVARRCAIAWERSAPASADHAYLARKNIGPVGLRVDRRGRLRVPMRNFYGQVRGFQTIDRSGRKLFQRGGQVHGTHLLLGAVQPDGVLLIAEGLATAATVHDATGAATCVAFGKFNFQPIATVYLKQYPRLRVGFCGDNDHHHPHRNPPLENVGLIAAKDAARTIGGTAIIPTFAPDEPGTDWNDWAATHGFEAVRAAIEAALPPPLLPPLHPHFPAPVHTPATATNELNRAVKRFFDSAQAYANAARDWRGRLAAIDEATPPKAPGRRSALRQARAEMADLHGPNWRALGRRMLVLSPAGSGKSTLTACHVAQAAGALGTVWFAVPRIENAEAIAVLIPGAAVVRGRSQVNPEDPEGGRMCLRHTTAEAVAHAGLPVSTSLCDDGEGRVCPFKADGSCPYQKQRRWLRSGEVRVFIVTHNYLSLAAAPMPPPDVVIVDERCIEPFIRQDEIGFDRLLPDAMENWQAVGLNAAMAYRRVMAIVRDALTDPAGTLAGLRARGIIDPSHLQSAIDYARMIEDREFVGDISPTMDDAEVIARAEHFVRSELGTIRKMLLALALELNQPRDQVHGVVFNPSKSVRVNGRLERQARITVYHRKMPAFGAKVPLLLLDASGDLVISRAIFGKNLDDVVAVCDRKVETIQVLDTTFARSSLVGLNTQGLPLSGTSVAKAERLREEIAEVINALGHKHQGAFFLASNKPVEKLLASKLNVEILTGHYGNLRGRNDIQHCVAGATLGREQPPATAMEDLARAIWADDPESLFLPGHYEKVTRGIRMRDGSAVPVKVDVHLDSRVQRMLELHREREGEQAGDRLRLIHNTERKTLYVLSNVPQDLTVDRVVTWRQLVHEMTGKRDNGREGTGRRIYGSRIVQAYRLGGGILPFSPAELVRLSKDAFNGLWHSERAVRDDFKKMADSAIEDLLAESAAFRPVLVRYRLKGQRCPSKALVSTGLPDGRAALQALLGNPVIYYEVKGTHTPPDYSQTDRHSPEHRSLGAVEPAGVISPFPGQVACLDTAHRPQTAPHQ